ncbi:unnamed protein product [Haemonchus placei]|uniref:RelA_SpoT domain-containing protein n=1 Tax=Haemonchus placei TaxID=6290 RepID=A0A0N4X0P7_HAEPC|nr:unnamed protein product [Haemonchus placei]
MRSWSVNIGTAADKENDSDQKDVTWAVKCPLIPNTVNGLSRSKSLRKDLSHPISSQGREIILQCFENPHSEFGNKVLQRIFEKRADYQKYVYTLGKERAYQMSIRLKDLVEEVVSKIFDPDHICSVSRTYGEEHVELKAYGFKPDFWVTIADAITVEGVILDMANHQVRFHTVTHPYT